MEKTIKIDGRDVRFKATGGIGYRYKAQFGREYIADAIALEEFAQSGITKQKKKTAPDGKVTLEKITEYDFTKFSLEMLYNLLWTLAKTADDSIPPPQEWLDTFNVFPVMDIYEQVKDILTANLKVDPKNA